MVTEKKELNVTVRYPSIGSLCTYLSSNKISSVDIYPFLDEMFVMGIQLAGKVLCRQISSQEFDDNKHFEGFWLVKNSRSIAEDVISKNLLEVMKAKGAVFNNPILRPALRLEARKRIGDTGLLDHLLKHMAGKIASGGVERFKRRHNADGAMEYWFESADLVKIRREAGVQDPYWSTPPPGWAPGDCPSQDPICAKELKLLKEENSKLRRDMKEMVSKKQLKEELENLIRDIAEHLTKKSKRNL